MLNPKPILIVGAGPVGLMLATLLHKMDVPFTIIDKKSAPSTDSKGLAINVSSLASMSVFGLDHLVGAEAGLVDRLTVFWQGKRLTAVNLNKLPQYLPSALVQPQNQTETELVTHLEKQGVAILWSHQLSQLSADDAGVKVKIRNENGEMDAQYQFLVSCEGKHSRVRDAIDTSFTGKDYGMYFLLGDFELTRSAMTGNVEYHIFDTIFFVFVPLKGNLWRIVVKQNGAVDTIDDEIGVTMSLINQYFGKDTVKTKPTWFSKAPFYHRVAAKLSSNNLFLAGDAAHLFSPIGGTGMNTGFQDVFNLAWKLSLVSKYIARPSLLATYDNERLPSITVAANVADMSTQLMANQLPHDHEIIQSVLPRLSNRDNLAKKLPFVHSGMASVTPLDLSGQKVEATFNHTLLQLIHALRTHSAEQIPFHGKVIALVNVKDALFTASATEQASLATMRQHLLSSQCCFIIYLSGSPQGVSATAPPGSDEIKIAKAIHHMECDNSVSLIRPDGLTLTTQGVADCLAITKLLDTHFCLHRSSSA